MFWSRAPIRSNYGNGSWLILSDEIDNPADGTLFFIDFMRFVEVKFGIAWGGYVRLSRLGSWVRFPVGADICMNNTSDLTVAILRELRNFLE